MLRALAETLTKAALVPGPVVPYSVESPSSLPRVPHCIQITQIAEARLTPTLTSVIVVYMVS